MTRCTWLGKKCYAQRKSLAAAAISPLYKEKEERLNSSLRREREGVEETIDNIDEKEQK